MLHLLIDINNKATVCPTNLPQGLHSVVSEMG